jgi:hypothetical protein
VLIGSITIAQRCCAKNVGDDMQVETWYRAIPARGMGNRAGAVRVCRAVPGSMFFAPPRADQFSAAGVAVPIGAAREFCATFRRTVGAQHAERRRGQTTSGGLLSTVWISVPPCRELVQARRPQPHGTGRVGRAVPGSTLATLVWPDDGNAYGAAPREQSKLGCAVAVFAPWEACASRSSGRSFSVACFSC